MFLFVAFVTLLLAVAERLLLLWKVMGNRGAKAGAHAERPRGGLPTRPPSRLADS